MTDDAQSTPTDATTPESTAPEDVSNGSVSATETIEATTPSPRQGVPLPGEPKWNPQPGQVVRVHQRITETTKKGQEKERIQIFEGLVIARRHGREAGGTFTVRKEAKGGYGVERIFPIFAPTIEQVDVVRQYRTRRAKLHHVRGKYQKKLREIPVRA